jgi:hypothetical protein
MVGAMLLVLPGPGLLVVIAGLAILATEHDWAKRYLDSTKDRWEKTKQKIASKSAKQKREP